MSCYSPYIQVNSHTTAVSSFKTTTTRTTNISDRTFYCFLTRNYNRWFTKPKIFKKFFKNYDVLQYLASHTKNYTQGFVISNFLLVQTPGKLRNLLIQENCQFWYKLNYSNFFQALVCIFEIHLIRKIFPKYIDTFSS